jgi:hypothetical protein
MADKYRVSSNIGTEAFIDHDTYAEAIALFIACVNDPTCEWVELWEVSQDSNTAMELCKFKRTR